MPAIPVTVEWARWGKTSSDRGYRLLRHSGGVLGEEHFNELFTRYSPGTLDRLPQVTASWLKHAGRYYLAVATHAEAEGGLYDATGRDVVVTSYFCVPFDQVVPAAVPYQVMYAAFRDIQALPDDGRPIALDLDIPELATPDDDRAVRVAALLLTDKPVCILGAEQAGLAERLRFVDAVASLLPYGMRTRLSVSTWVSSTFRGHKFRLFFAHAPRGADDYLVDWHRPDHTPIGHLYADEYLDWLRNEIRRPVLQLAAEIVPVGFSRRDVLEMLEMLQRPGPRPAWHALARHADEQAFPDRGEPACPDRTRKTRTEELLADCARRLDGDDPGGFDTCVRQLRHCLAQPATEGDRQVFRQIIQDRRLLRDNLPIGDWLKVDFYEVLLRLAFDTPVTYRTYCEIAACADTGEAPLLPLPLREAMYRLRPTDLSVQLLVLAALDDDRLKKALRKSWQNSGNPVSLAADHALCAQHAPIVYKAIGRSLELGFVRQPNLRAILNGVDFLAGALERRHRKDPQLQFYWLTEFLQLAYDGLLTREDVAEVLHAESFAPTLCLAVLARTEPRALALVMDEFVRRAPGADLAEQARTELLPWAPTSPEAGLAGGSPALLPAANPDKRGLKEGLWGRD